MNSTSSTNNKANFLLISIASIIGIATLFGIYYFFGGDNGGGNKQSSYLLVNKDLNIETNKDVDKDIDKEVNNVRPMDSDKRYNDEPQVYNISENVYTYDDAEAVCKLFGGELATYQQLRDAYKKGANWCNYGWVKGKMALYPIQKQFWQKLQENDDEGRNDCGTPGINGAIFDPNLTFGVNCYGVKPPPRPHERIKQKFVSDKDRRLALKVAALRSKADQITITPFNSDDWASCS